MSEWPATVKAELFRFGSTVQHTGSWYLDAMLRGFSCWTRVRARSSGATAACLAVPLVLASFLVVGVAAATTHVDSNDPLTEGWTIEPADTGCGSTMPIASDADFPAVAAWEVNAVGLRCRYRVDGPNTGVSWSFMATMRVADLSDALDANVVIEVANGVDRWFVTFGSNANGDTLMDFIGGGSFMLAAQQAGLTDYFTIEIVYDAASDMADVFVEGVLRESGWIGTPGPGIQRVNFGDGQTSSSGRGRFALIEFQTTRPDGTAREIFASVGSALYSLDPFTAGATLVGDNGVHDLRALAISPVDQALWAVTFVSPDYFLSMVDKGDGSVAPVVQLEDPGFGCRGTPGDYRNLTVGTDGTVYVTLHLPRCFAGAAIFSIDLSTGLRTPVSNGTGGGGAIATRSATELIASDYAGVRAVDIATGELSILVDPNAPNPGNDPACSGSRTDIALSPGEDVAYFRQSMTCGLGTIDLTTGLTTAIGATGLAFGASIAVPDAEGGWLAVAVLLVLGWLDRVRSRRGSQHNGLSGQRRCRRSSRSRASSRPGSSCRTVVSAATASSLRSISASVWARR